MELYVIDSETCSLNSPAVLIQYQLIDTEGTDKNNDNIKLHDVWKRPIYETLDLLEKFSDMGIIGFNLVFDWYHFQRLYNSLVEVAMFVGYDTLPEDHIELFA